MDSQQGSDAVPQSSPEIARETSLRPIWRRWGDVLIRNALGDLAAALIDAARPLALVSAQLLYAGGPILGANASKLAQVLESEPETAEFIEYLRHAGDGEPGRLRGDT